MMTKIKEIFLKVLEFYYQFEIFQWNKLMNGLKNGFNL